MDNGGTQHEVSVTTLADTLGVQADTLSRWLRRRHRDTTHVVDRRDGGKALMVNAEGQALARERYAGKQADAEPVTPGRKQPDSGTPTDISRTQQTYQMPQEVAERLAALTGRAEAAEALSVERGREIERMRVEDIERLRVDLEHARAALAREVHARMAAEVREGRAEESRERWRQWARLVEAAWAGRRWWRRGVWPTIPEPLHDGELAAPEG